MTAPASADQIAAWWHRWPEANVGVVTGLVSGVAVVDIDPRNGGDDTLRRLEEAWDLLPITSEVCTGGGGRHLWFSVDRHVATGELGPGIELKAEGGMVVAPPSLHVSGRRYVWRPGGKQRAPEVLPGWLDALVGGHSPKRTTGATVPPPRTSSEQAAFAAAWSRAGIELESGDRYYRCPFHDDHHPSLHVDSDGCRWYCFGCGAGGGISRLRQLLGEPEGSHLRTRMQGSTGRSLPVTLHGQCEVEVVGESHYQDELLELTGGRRRYGGVDVEAVAELVPEPACTFDANAIAVQISDRTVGYVGREDLAWLRPLVDDSLDMHGIATCRARIRGGWDRGGVDVGSFGVTLLVPKGTDKVWW